MSVQSSCAKTTQSAKRKLGEVEQGKASGSCAAQFCHPADRSSEVKIALVYPPYTRFYDAPCHPVCLAELNPPVNPSVKSPLKTSFILYSYTFSSNLVGVSVLIQI